MVLYAIMASIEKCKIDYYITKCKTNYYVAKCGTNYYLAKYEHNFNIWKFCNHEKHDLPAQTMDVSIKQIICNMFYRSYDTKKAFFLFYDLAYYYKNICHDSDATSSVLSHRQIRIFTFFDNSPYGKLSKNVKNEFAVKLKMRYIVKKKYFTFYDFEYFNNIIRRQIRSKSYCEFATNILLKHLASKKIIIIGNKKKIEIITPCFLHSKYTYLLKNIYTLCDNVKSGQNS